MQRRKLEQMIVEQRGYIAPNVYKRLPARQHTSNGWLLGFALFYAAVTLSAMFLIYFISKILIT